MEFFSCKAVVPDFFLALFEVLFDDHDNVLELRLDCPKQVVDVHADHKYANTVFMKMIECCEHEVLPEACNLRANANDFAPESASGVFRSVYWNQRFKHIVWTKRLSRNPASRNLLR